MKIEANSVRFMMEWLKEYPIRVGSFVMSLYIVAGYFFVDLFVVQTAHAFNQLSLSGFTAALWACSTFALTRVVKGLMLGQVDANKEMIQRLGNWVIEGRTWVNDDEIVKMRTWMMAAQIFSLFWISGWMLIAWLCQKGLIWLHVKIYELPPIAPGLY